MTDTQTHWKQIWLAWPNAVNAIPRSSQPSDGQPTGSIDPRKSPVNDTAQSWCAEVEQAAFGWAAQGNNVDERIRWLTTNDPSADDLDASGWEDFTTLTQRLAREAQRFIPAEEKVTQLKPPDCTGIHADTIELLAKLASSITKKTIKPSTLRNWVQYGWITKTDHGYPLTQALERINK